MEEPMVTPWTLVTQSEAWLVLVCWSILCGFMAGMAFCVCLFWRRITRPLDDRPRVWGR